MTILARILAAAAFAAVFSAPYAAISDGHAPNPTLPEDYETTYYNHYNNDRMSVEGQAIRSFANDVAVTSAAETGELAYGSKLVGQLWSVMMDADGEPLVSSLDRRIRDEHIATLVMERVEGADAAYDDGMTVGDWAFAVYNADGTPKGDGDVSACRACHEPLADQQYFWSVEHLTKKLID